MNELKSKMGSLLKYCLVLLMLGFAGCATSETSFNFEEYYAEIDAYEIDEVDQEPEIINDRNLMARYMNYPEEARRNGVEGRVVVGLVVDKDGNPHNFKIIESLGYGLDVLVLNTIANSKFKPAMKDGQAVNVKYSIPTEFNLQRSGQ